MTATDLAIDLARTAATAASDKLASDIRIVDVSDRLAITDCFVLATGSNERQIGAIVDAVEERLREAGYKPIRREGERDGRWVLLDFVEIVVHVQHAEERVYYGLDRLWKDCPTVPLDGTVPLDSTGPVDQQPDRIPGDDGGPAAADAGPAALQEDPAGAASGPVDDDPTGPDGERTERS